MSTKLICILPLLVALAGCEHYGTPIAAGSCTNATVHHIPHNVRSMRSGEYGKVISLRSYQGKLYVNSFSQADDPTDPVMIQRVPGGVLADCAKVTSVLEEPSDLSLIPVVGSLR